MGHREPGGMKSQPGGGRLSLTRRRPPQAQAGDSDCDSSSNTSQAVALFPRLNLWFQELCHCSGHDFFALLSQFSSTFNDWVYKALLAEKMHGSVAQLVERALRMREAPGSKPGVSILHSLVLLIFKKINFCFPKIPKIILARCGGRTHDHKVKSLALCQLS